MNISAGSLNVREFNLREHCCQRVVLFSFIFYKCPTGCAPLWSGASLTTLSVVGDNDTDRETCASRGASPAGETEDYDVISIPDSGSIPKYRPLSFSCQSSFNTWRAATDESPLTSTHLLILDEPFAHDLIDGGFHESGLVCVPEAADRFAETRD